MVETMKLQNGKKMWMRIDLKKKIRYWALKEEPNSRRQRAKFANKVRIFRNNKKNNRFFLTSLITPISLLEGIQ